MVRKLLTLNVLQMENSYVVDYFRYSAGALASRSCEFVYIWWLHPPIIGPGHRGCAHSIDPGAQPGVEVVSTPNI